MCLDEIFNPDLLADYFWSNVHKTDTCWLWTRAREQQGYGVTSARIRGKRRKLRAHRLAYLLTHGFLPDDLLVMHACDVPACVRPDHLELGTYRENMQDMVAKGRHRGGCKPGEQNPRAVLTYDDVRAIRECYADGTVSQRALAAQYGVSRRQVRDILSGRRWT